MEKTRERVRREKERARQRPKKMGETKEAGKKGALVSPSLAADLPSPDALSSLDSCA